MTITLAGLDLPNSLQNTAEFSAQKVSMTQQRTLAGSIVVYTGQRTNGFPIVLESGTDFGWVKRSVVIQLAELANQSGVTHALAYKGTTYTVMFDHTQGTAFEATPIIPYSTPSSDDYYRVKLSFITM